MVKIIVPLLLFVIGLPSYAHDGYTCPDNPKVSDFYGTYKVVKIIEHKYRSPTEKQKASIQQETIAFSKDWLFEFFDGREHLNRISNTQIFCHLAPHEEGEVAHHGPTPFFRPHILHDKALRFLKISGEHLRREYKLVGDQMWGHGPAHSLVVFERVPET